MESVTKWRTDLDNAAKNPLLNKIEIGVQHTLDS